LRVDIIQITKSIMLRVKSGNNKGEQTNPRKTNPANNQKWQSPCYSGKKIRNWHVCEIAETKMAKSVL